ncbi:MAG TPA: AAA family ATPase, partial [Capillimicrobium sp.]
GGFLPGVGGSWVDRRRDELRGLEADALEVHVEGRLRGGGDAEPAARALIELAPYRESGHRARMEALARRGNVAEALLAYEDVRRLLREELGIDPSPGLRELHRALVSGETVAAPASRRLALPLTLRGQEPFVGRAAALERLRAASVGELVLVAGEPGIGKTALAARFAQELWEDGALVLYGHCDEHAPIPFQPFVEALRHWVTCAPADELSARLPPSADELARLLPELRRRLPASGEPSTDPETRRYRLFEAIHELLSELAAHAPVVLVLDDLQWAEPSSLVLLRHLLRRGGGALVIGLYRPTEASRELLGLDGGTTIALDGLSEAEVAALVTAAGSPPALAATLRHDTGGNPLFVGEVLRHLRETGAGSPGALELPTRVRDVIARRLARLSEEARRALAVAAVAGSEFELEVVAAAADRDPDTLAETLEEPVAADLLCEVAGDPGRYRFAHALVRATIEAQLTATRRERLHRRLAAALPRARAAERAQHTYAAGERGAAVVAAADEAARAAAGVLAYEEAVRHYEHAVAAAEDDPGFPADERCDLLLALAGALRDAGGDPRGDGDAAGS